MSGSDPTSEADLLQKESESLLKRRQSLNLADPNEEAPKEPQDLDPVGLAFSGGGIRSATFNLGILQGLANLKLLKYFDYLSTVSGGGYIGSWFTAWIQREGTLGEVEKKLDPEWAEQGCQDKEPNPIRYLRRHSNYLAPRVGFLSADTWVLWASYLRNFLLNQLLLFPTVIAVLLLTRILLVIYHPDAPIFLPTSEVIHAADWPRPLHGVLIGMEYVFGGLVGLLWFIAAFFAFWGSSRVRLAEEKKPSTGTPLRPRGLVWGVLVPLVLSAILICWIPASRLLVNEMRGPILPAWFETAGIEFLCFALVPAIVVVFAYLFHRQFQGWAWHLIAVFAACLLGGSLLYFVCDFLQSLCQPGPLELPDYVKARAAARITTFGPPMVLGVFVLTIFVGIAFLRQSLGEDLREWWSSVCARLLIVMVIWLAVTFISLYATAQLIWAGPWIQTAIGSGWILTVITGVLAGGSSLTGRETKTNPLAELLARLAPSVFVVGIIAGISLLIPVLLDEHPDWKQIPSQMEVLKRTDPEITPTKVSDLKVQQFGKPDVHERRVLEEHHEALNDSEVARYLYWMGMFHVPFNESHWSHFLPQILWEEAPKPVVPVRAAGPPAKKKDDDKSPVEIKAKPPEKKEAEGEFRLRMQDVHSLLNASRGKAIPETLLQRLKEPFVSSIAFKMVIEKNESLAKLFDSEKAKNTWIEDAEDRKEWKPKIRYTLYPADIKYLEQQMGGRLPKEILDLVNQPFSLKKFQEITSKNAEAFQKAFPEENPAGAPLYQRHLERIAMDPVLINFAPGWLLIKVSLALFVCFLILLIASFCVDINIFSLNAIDGNRLIRAYLGASRQESPRKGISMDPEVRQPDPITGFDPADDLPLQKLANVQPPGEKIEYQGPYYLINTALNLVHSQDLSWQERKAESFVFTPDFCGSESTGYRPTKEYAGGVSVGTAVAISGAAASPNSGYHSSPAVTALLTIFNARMGAWLGNPFEKKRGWTSKDTWKKRGPRWGYIHLLKELFGLTDDKSPYVYLSDGGHFENLGVYELVRRRCRFVVACDAGCDPLHTFFDLGSLIRKVRIDFGIRIEIDHSTLKKAVGQNRTSWHCAIGRIRYDDVVKGMIPGILVYIKPSLSGDEPADVLQYATEHSTFPQETTNDQFFSESQFESYRALGQHVAESVFSEAVDELRRIPDRKGDSLHEQHQRRCRVLFSSLSRRWFAMPPEYERHFIESTRGYTELQQTLANDDRLRRMTTDMYPELQKNLEGVSTKQEESFPQNGSSEAAELHTILRLVQIMENAWLTLNLDANYAHPLNRGWLDVFFRWTNSATFRRYWPFVRSEFAQRFVNFCERQMRFGQVSVKRETIKGLIPAVLLEEYSHQWPTFPALSSLLARLMHGPDIKPLGWLLHITMDEQPSPTPCGVAMVLNEESVPGASPAHELVIWIRGAYRNSGNGRKVMEQILTLLRQLWNHEFALRVRLPNREMNGPGGKLLKRMWLTFFHHHDFRWVRSENNGDVDVLERIFPVQSQNSPPIESGSSSSVVLP